MKINIIFMICFRNIVAGTTKGYIQYIDMKNGKCLKTFTGMVGSVTSLLCDPIEPVLISTSLDRFLRLYNLETKQLLHKVNIPSIDNMLFYCVFFTTSNLTANSHMISTKLIISGILKTKFEKSFNTTYSKRRERRKT